MIDKKTALICISIILAFLTLTIFFQPILVKGPSMQPNFKNNDYLISSKMAYKNELPKRGDVVIIDSTALEEKIIKRVIGTEGDTITIKDKKLYINGDLTSEPYVSEKNFDNTEGEWVVPEDCVFVMGDNRANSVDSRFLGADSVELSDIKGKVILRLFPFDKIEVF